MAETRTAEDTKDTILSTAERLLRRYGVSKMTVVDIARACGMSHANVYRFFDTKACIIDAITERWLDEAQDTVRQATGAGATAGQRLEAFIVELHRLKRRKLTDDPEIYQAYDAVAREARQVFDRYSCVMTDLLKQILQDGVAAGEFKIADIDAAVTAVRDASVKFHNPAMVTQCVGEPTEDQARRLARLLIGGLQSGAI